MCDNPRDALGGVRNGKGEKMKILFIDDEYYRYPEGINAVEDYMAYLNNSNSFFIKMVRFETDNCRFPYLIYCKNYIDGLKEDNLSGHRGNITLDGDCFLFSKIDEKEQECME